MINRKNHHSIIFLTTLSVYLGLVLVGGGATTPSVFAQAAMTQKFDVQNEIEVKDDLDKKPDDNKNLENYFSFYQKLYELTNNLAKENPRFLKDGKYEANCFNTFRANLSETLRCGGSGYISGYITTPIQHIGKIFPHTSDENTEQSSVNLILSDSDFFIKTTFTQDFDWQAKQFSEFYNNTLSRIKLQQLNNPQIIFYQNTQITSVNNQIFIVTRLPRAAIDELLANKDAR